MPECAQPLKFARPFEAARSRGERPDVANDPDANRSDVFVLRPYNVCVHQRRLRIARAAVWCNAC